MSGTPVKATWRIEAEILVAFGEWTFFVVWVKNTSRPSLSDFFTMYASNEMTRSMLSLCCIIVAELSIRKI